MAITIRKAEERGRADFGWLDSRHTFSFGEYYDRRYMGYHALRVINDDRVSGGGGFPPHGHRDMEIISIVLEGALAHKDSTGTGSVIRPGDVQRMSAGSGIVHSEFNASPSELVRFLQIWILPGQLGIQPGYEQKTFSADERENKFRLVASPTGEQGSLTIHQDAKVYLGDIAAGKSVSFKLPAGRYAWIQVARGSAELNGQPLQEGDGASIDGETELTLSGKADSQTVLFDLA